MANHKSALKRIRTSEKKRIRNRVFISRARTEIKVVRAELTKGDVEEARKALKTAIRTLDKAANKGVLHRNNASRRKGRLMKQLAALEASKK